MHTIKLLIIILIVSCSCSPLLTGLPLDLVVIVDTSNSMERYFDDLLHYVITDILKKNLSPGDVFHLIRFAGYPVHELTQTISDDESTDAIIKKISFLKGKLLFGKYTDLLSALKYLILYAEGLHKRNNKKLLLLSDFIHNPPGDSPYAGISLEALENELAAQARKIGERDGWSIRFIRFPVKSIDNDNQYRDPTSDQGTDTEKDPYSGPIGTDSGDRIADDDLSDTSDDDLSDTSDYSSDTETKTHKDDEVKDVVDIISDTFKIDIPIFDENEKEDLSHKTSGFPRLEFPGDMGNKGRVFNVPFIIHNYLDDDIIIKLRTLEYSGKNILNNSIPPQFIGPHASKNFKVKIKLPADIKEGPCTLPVSLSFDDEHRIAPREGILSFYYTGDRLVAFFNFIGENLTVIISILIVVFILLIIFIFIRMRVFEGVFSDILTTSDWRGTAATSPLEGEMLIEMRVSFQNPHIGYRNIHKIENNKSLSVGGGFSSFLIFLIPMPSHIAEIQNIEGTYIFTPVKDEFFPDLKGPVENCLNKDIPVVSKHGYRSVITFKMYESPLSRINKLLHSIQHEG